MLKPPKMAPVAQSLSPPNRDHIVIFPFMAKGHTIPLLQLAAFLSSHHNLSIRLITTPSNSSFFHAHLPSHLHPNISILSLPFPSFPPLPPRIESTDSLPSHSLYPVFLEATTLLLSPFRQLLSLLSPPPLCLISDFFLGFTLLVTKELNIPRVVFHGMSTFSMALCKSLAFKLPPDDGALFNLTGTPPSLMLTRDIVPQDILSFSNSDDPMTHVLMNYVFNMKDVGNTDTSSWGILVNSFTDVDQGFVKLLESFYHEGARAWLMGPLCLLAESMLNEETIDEESCLAWLDERKKSPNSVVYVSFGTQTHVSDEQLDEVAHGLVASVHPFIWAVRSKTWIPPESLTTDISSKGKIVRGWVPQKQVLGHRSVGGFITHCGWNSILESICYGVPLLCWPMIAEQALNEKHVVEILGNGVSIGAKRGEILGRKEVERGVKELIEEGKVREKAKELRRAAEVAVAEGGASRVVIQELLDKLRKMRGE
ncbi:hypothetical protein LUZ60_000786 [Juncus effusus]|nr:hypothetical protein LUZ60_000786 [Juncus effusus]